jgi:hypothetical protein
MHCGVDIAVTCIQVFQTSCLGQKTTEGLGPVCGIIPHCVVIPEQAGSQAQIQKLDARFRGHDIEKRIFPILRFSWEGSQ